MIKEDLTHDRFKRKIYLVQADLIIIINPVCDGRKKRRIPLESCAPHAEQND